MNHDYSESYYCKRCGISVEGARQGLECCTGPMPDERLEEIRAGVDDTLEPMLIRELLAEIDWLRAEQTGVCHG